MDPRRHRLYQSAAASWLEPAQSLTDLSVSLEDRTYGDFRLDRGVQLPAGGWFSLPPVGNTSAVGMAGFSLPRCLGTQVQDSSYRISPGMQVQSLYTFFQAWKEPGLLSPGEPHPLGDLVQLARLGGQSQEERKTQGVDDGAGGVAGARQ